MAELSSNGCVQFFPCSRPFAGLAKKATQDGEELHLASNKKDKHTTGNELRYEFINCNKYGYDDDI